MDSLWYYIFQYLPGSDQFNFSLTNKENLKNVTNFWYDLTSTKLENINKTLVSNKKVTIFIKS